MNILASVIICTHNPNLDYLGRALVALKYQTLALSSWELILVDNKSDRVLKTEVDLSWHPNSKHVREDNLGLTFARFRGIKEAKAQLLVFVDDDNILDPSYLEAAAQISKDYPFIGAWGGQIDPEFEVPPPEWTKPYWKFLTIRKFEKDKWSNLLHQYETTPCGSGMCIRKFIAEEYCNLVSNDPRRLGLDRKGKQLISGGDTDMAFTACDLGFGTGQFTSLKLTHLMPSDRFNKDYLSRLMEGIAYSDTMLDSFRGKLPKRLSLLSELFDLCRSMKMGPIDRHLYYAGKKGRKLATQEILNS